jgi:hypothetical protein
MELDEDSELSLFGYILPGEFLSGKNTKAQYEYELLFPEMCKCLGIIFIKEEKMLRFEASKALALNVA